MCMHSRRERAHGLDGDEDGVVWNGMEWDVKGMLELEMMESVEGKGESVRGGEVGDWVCVCVCWIGGGCCAELVWGWKPWVWFMLEGERLAFEV